MYQIVLADDEQIERESLKSSIEKILSDCSIKTACNGQEAIEAALTVHADMVFMDIQMPCTDGIAAARKIKSELPNCEIMFLTAFSEFCYAREALDMGASGYLLKPCSTQNLAAALHRMIGRIDSIRDEVLLNERRQKNMEKLTREFEEQIVLTVMGGYLSSERIQKQFAMMGITFRCGIFAILKSPDGISAERLRGMVDGLCWRSGIRPFSYEYDDCLYVFVVSSLDKELSLYIYKLMSELANQVMFQQNKRLFCSVSTQFDSMENAQDSFYLGYTALRSFSDKDTVICCTDRILDKRPFSLEESLSRSITEGYRETSINLIKTYIEGLCARQFDICIIIERTQSCLKKVFECLKKHNGIEYESLFSFKKRLNDSENTKALIENAIELITEIQDYEAGNINNRLLQIKSEIEEYMRNNFTRDIFMQQVAHDMNYSIAHFSRLFKNCFNKNFVTYLTEMRIDEAKELLQRPTVSIKLIGEKVGYKDSSHFTKAFKRIVGVSPSEFRSSVFSHRHYNHL